MREIKFRAYVKPIKWMLPVERINFDYQEVEVDVSTVGDTSEYGFKEIELMQYTGLKDKNGVEIFEGDIVSVHDEEEPLLVKFIEERAAFVLYNVFKYYYWNFDEYKSFEIEIIGNKFEDSEILGEFSE